MELKEITKSLKCYTGNGFIDTKISCHSSNFF